MDDIVKNLIFSYKDITPCMNGINVMAQHPLNQIKKTQMIVNYSIFEFYCSVEKSLRAFRNDFDPNIKIKKIWY